MVFKVALVEDDSSQAEHLSGFFSKYSQDNDFSFDIDYYENGNVFMINYRPIYDLVLMDVGLPYINGMDTAVWLRKTDASVTIVFVTNMAQFAVRGYEVNAFDFIVKPVSYENFNLKLQRIIIHLSTQIDKQISIVSGDEIYRVLISHIKYVEIHGHQLLYHTTDGDVASYGNLKKVEETLSSTSFCRCNSCYLINLKYVQAVKSNAVIVAGDTLQMSRPKKKMFIQALNTYMGENI